MTDSSDSYSGGWDDLSPEQEAALEERTAAASLRWLEQHWGDEAVLPDQPDQPDQPVQVQVMEPEPEVEEQQAKTEAAAKDEIKTEIKQKIAGLPAPPDPTIPTRDDINAERRRDRARKIAREENDDADAALLAEEWAGTSGEEFDPDDPDPVPCVLEISPDWYIFVPGLHIIFGKRGSMKTWICYVAALQEARRGHGVLILDYEMTYKKVMRRLRKLGMTKKEARLIRRVQPSTLLTRAGQERLKQEWPVPPSLVILDSMGSAMGQAGLNPIDNLDCATFLNGLPLWLKREWQDTVVLIVDHVPKGAEDPEDPIGAQAKGAYCEGLFYVRVLSPISKKSRGMGRVKQTKARDGESDEGEEVFDFAFGGGGDGGDLVFSPVDTDVVALPESMDLASAAETRRRIAEHVGEQEGVVVTEARKALRIGNSKFTARKNELIAMKVIENPSTGGLFKGPKWQSYIDDGEAGLAGDDEDG